METNSAILAESNDQDDLTELQLQAVELLVAGTSISAAAREVGVTRETVSRWANQDAGFMAALNRLRRDVHKVHKDKLRQLATRAYEVLDELMEADSPPRIRLTAALAVLEAAKDLEEEVGFTTRQGVEIERDANRVMLGIDVITWDAWNRRFLDDARKWNEKERRHREQEDRKRLIEQGDGDIGD